MTGARGAACWGTLLALFGTTLPASGHAEETADWARVVELKAGSELVVEVEGSVPLVATLGRANPSELVLLDFSGSALSETLRERILEAVSQHASLPKVERNGRAVDAGRYVRSFPQEAVIRVTLAGKGEAGFAGVLFGGLGGFIAAGFTAAAVSDDPDNTAALGVGGLGLVAGSVVGYKIATRGKGTVYERAKKPSDSHQDSSLHARRMAAWITRASSR